MDETLEVVELFCGAVNDVVDLLTRLQALRLANTSGHDGEQRSHFQREQLKQSYLPPPHFLQNVCQYCVHQRLLLMSPTHCCRLQRSQDVLVLEVARLRLQEAIAVHERNNPSTPDLPILRQSLKELVERLNVPLLPLPPLPFQPVSAAVALAPGASSSSAPAPVAASTTGLFGSSPASVASPIFSLGGASSTVSGPLFVGSPKSALPSFGGGSNAVPSFGGSGAPSFGGSSVFAPAFPPPPGASFGSPVAPPPTGFFFSQTR